MFQFPKMHRVTEIEQQLDKVNEELAEFIDALQNSDAEHIIEEYYDTIHALEQIGRLLSEEHGNGMFELGRYHVLKKNQARGYYR